MKTCNYAAISSTFAATAASRSYCFMFKAINSSHYSKAIKDEMF